MIFYVNFVGCKYSICKNLESTKEHLLEKIIIRKLVYVLTSSTSNLRIDGLYSGSHFFGLHPVLLCIFCLQCPSWNYLDALGPSLLLLNSIIRKQPSGIEILISTPEYFVLLYIWFPAWLYLFIYFSFR